jgi:hypothetical protein
MSKVVPAGYILTDDAIKEIVTSGSEWARLNTEWQQATGEAKAKTDASMHGGLTSRAIGSPTRRFASGLTLPPSIRACMR